MVKTNRSHLRSKHFQIEPIELEILINTRSNEINRIEHVKILGKLIHVE